MGRKFFPLATTRREDEYFTTEEDQAFPMAPAELEMVIRQLDGVEDVAVAGVENPAGGELPVAVVVKKAGAHVTAEQVVQQVKENLPEMKHLYGGVVFVDRLPLTSTGKVNQREIKKIASTSETIRCRYQCSESVVCPNSGVAPSDPKNSVEAQ